MDIVYLNHIYYAFLTKLLQAFPETSLEKKYFKESHFIFEVSINGRNLEEVKKVMADESELKFSYKTEELSLEDLLLKFDQTGNNVMLRNLDNYFLYGKNYFSDEADKYFYDELSTLEFISSDFTKKILNRNVQRTISNIQYFYTKYIYTLYQGATIHEREKFVEDNFREVEAHLTVLFINLASYIKDFKSYLPLQSIISSIPITHYQKYQGITPKDVKDIGELIIHFRDATCHLEKTSYISKDPLTGTIRHLNTNFQPTLTLQFGSGNLELKNQLEPFIRELAKLNYDSKLKVLIISDDKGKEIFCDIIFLKEQVPILNSENIGKFKIDNTDSGFKISLPSDF